MSIHKSLVPASKLRRHRNVLSRDERLAILEKEGRWKDGASYFGLYKVKNIKIRAKAKVKKEEKPAEAAAGATPVAGAPVAAPAKGASPATATKPSVGATAAGTKPAAAKPAEKKK